jgi:hypothetical protein
MLCVSEEVQDLFEPSILNNLIPITELLAMMDFFRIVTELHEHLNYAHCRKWIYPPILLFKLLLVLAFRKQSYRRLVKSLTIEDCITLGIQEMENGEFLIPSASNVHDFAYNRLGLEFFTKLCTLMVPLHLKTFRMDMVWSIQPLYKLQGMINLRITIPIIHVKCIKCISSI